MSIVVTCRCGQSFAAELRLAGSIVDCPSCGNTLTIPDVTDERASIVRHAPVVPSATQVPSSGRVLGSPSDSFTPPPRSFMKTVWVPLICVGSLLVCALVAYLLIRTASNMDSGPAGVPSSWVWVDWPDSSIRYAVPIFPKIEDVSSFSPADTMATATVPNRGSYIVVQWKGTYAGKDPEQSLDFRCRDYANDMQGRVIEQKSIEYEGFPARKLEVRGTSGTGVELHRRCQFVLVDGTMYEMSWNGFPQQASDNDISTFFNSLEVVSKNSN